MSEFKIWAKSEWFKKYSGDYEPINNELVNNILKCVSYSGKRYHYYPDWEPEDSENLVFCANEVVKKIQELESELSKERVKSEKLLKFIKEIEDGRVFGGACSSKDPEEIIAESIRYFLKETEG